ncbi:MAG: BNR-4 repeat-containing protein [Anaerolineae bacterium]|nr:BNR-4 repeat-containing protein [Phycisphaerae bacterium]
MSDIRVLNPNGGWCWFQDERAIVHGDQLFFGSVASPSGDLNVTSVDLKNGASRTTTLHEKFESDDHDAPALFMREDGQLLAMYSKHSNDNVIRWRVGSQPERTLEVKSSHGVCYQNIYRLRAESDRLYSFFRGDAFNPHYITSDDDGDTWKYGGRLLHATGERGARRPYLCYAGNGRDTIHFIATEGHPNDVANSIYHGIIRGGKIHRSDGEVVGELSSANETKIKVTDLTRIYTGGEHRIAWTIGIHLDRDEHPYIAFSTRRDDAGTDLWYHTARSDGTRWHERELAHAGSRLYNAEKDYSGLVALHPHDPNVLYISTNADPLSGEPLLSRADNKRHWEIFQGACANDRWTWTAITIDSTSDNIRPIVAPGNIDRAPLIWLRGTYRTYCDYDLAVAGLLAAP